MRSACVVLALAVAAAPVLGEAAEKAPTAPAPAPANLAVIQIHVGVPGVVSIGQPLSQFLAKFPTARSVPVADQPNLVRIQVAPEGISCLAVGATPATMTLESIGFNFGPMYEGVGPGRRRTVEGIGTGSSVNELLGTYGRPAESTVERALDAPPPKPGDPAPERQVRHIYKSADGSVTTYFVVQGSDVVRMVIGRPAAIGKNLQKGPAAGSGEDADEDGAGVPKPKPAPDSAPAPQPPPAPREDEPTAKPSSAS